MTNLTKKSRRWVAIFLVLLAIFLLVRVHHQYKKVDLLPTSRTASLKSQINHPQTVEFDFYKALPDMVVVDSKDARKVGSHLSQNKGTYYILQVASSPELKDAEHIRDRLQGFGYRAHIQKYQKGEVIWYRVMVGPYQSAEMAERGNEQLKQQNFEPLLLKVAQESPA